jgi:minor extracellular serine protease Vpr
MRPLTDQARKKTNVDDVLTHSADAVTAGLPNAYDGSGVLLGVIDTGIDFQHIAFKDASGNSRIKRAYVYDGTNATDYTTISEYSSYHRR